MGELQKRIKKHKFGSYGESVDTKVVLETIKEMAKEFPCYPKCHYIGTDTTTSKLGKTEFAPCEECYQWKGWFVKWFGSAVHKKEVK